MASPVVCAQLHDRLDSVCGCGCTEASLISASGTKQKLDPYVLAITIFAVASVAAAGTAVFIYIEVRTSDPPPTACNCQGTTDFV